MNNSGFDQIICCTENGEIFGYVNSQDNPNLIDNSMSTKEKTSQREEIAKYEKLIGEKKVIMIIFIFIFQIFSEQLENLTIQLSNKYKLNASKDENILPSNTQVKIDLQSNNEEVKYKIIRFFRNVLI